MEPQGFLGVTASGRVVLEGWGEVDHPEPQAPRRRTPTPTDRDATVGHLRGIGDTNMVKIRELFSKLCVQTHSTGQSQGENHANRAETRRTPGAFVPGWPRHTSRRYLIAGFLVVSLIVTSCFYGCARVQQVVAQSPMAKDAGLSAVVCGGVGAVAGAALAAALAKTNKPWWTLVSTLFGAGV